MLNKVFQGTIVAGKDKIIRTSKLSSSFELIQSLAEEKCDNVTVFEQIRTHFKGSGGWVRPVKPQA